MGTAVAQWLEPMPIGLVVMGSFLHRDSSRLTQVKLGMRNEFMDTDRHL